MAAQIQLANTFNEFRQAYNDAANDISTLQSANTTLFNGVANLRANTIQLEDLNVSGGRILVSRAPVSGTGALIDDDSGLTFDTSTNKLTVDGPLDANGALRSANVTANNLTTGRVVLATTGGLLTDDADLTYNSSTNVLTVNGLTVGGTLGATGNIDTSGSIRSANLTANNLTSGRILISGASGLISDDSGLTYNSGTDAVTASGAVGVNSLSATTWANAANMFVSANVNVVDTVNALGHLHAGGVEAWITAKGEDNDIHLIAAVDDNDGPHDIAIVNRNNNANAYGEFIAMNNAGNTEQGWVSMGINATNYNQGAFAITKGDDAYILYQAPQGTTKSGDLVIGTGGNGTGNKIIFSANGFDDPANNTQITIDPGVRVHVEVPTQSISTTTGALTVAGGLGVVGNMNVGGNVTITGSITLLGAGNTVSTDTLSVANAMLFLANGNAADSIDLGVIGEYTAGTKKYTGIVRDASDGVVKFFQDASTKPANTVNFAQAGLNYANVQVGALLASNTTATAGPGSGALVVTGGAGIGGGVWAGGSIRTDATTASTSVSTGALIVNGGAGISGNVIAGAIQNTPIGSITKSTGAFTTLTASGVTTVTDATASSSSSTGALVVTGGLGVGGAIDTNSTLRANGVATFASTVNITGGSTHAGILYANNTTASTSTTTGGLVALGGVGIAGNTNIGGDLTVTGSIIANEIVEGVTDVAVSTNTYNVDYNNGNIFYATSAPSSADFTLALTNVPTTNGRVTNITLILPQGATARRPSANAISINGTSTLVNWVGGNTAITPTASKTDIFNFTILRRSNTFTVAGTLTANTVL